MSIARHIEVSAESSKGFENACEQAIKDASETLHGIKQLYVKNVLCEVNDQNRIVNWRFNGKITFVVEREKKQAAWGQGLTRRNGRTRRGRHPVPVNTTSSLNVCRKAAGR